jgi:hypothetical protein
MILSTDTVARGKRQMYLALHVTWSKFCELLRRTTTCRECKLFSSIFFFFLSFFFIFFHDTSLLYEECPGPLFLSIEHALTRFDLIG